MSELVSEIAKETFDVDGRAWRTIKTLFLRPGQLTCDFLAGRRKMYTPPLRIYLFISVSFFVVMAWVARQGILLGPSDSPRDDAAVQAQFMSDDLPRLMFVLLPVFALILKGLFRRRLYFDHLIFSVHLHSAAYVILAAMLPFERIAETNVAAMLLQVVLLAYFLFYVVAALRRVYAITWIGAIARFAVLFFAYLIVVSGLIEATSTFLIISDQTWLGITILKASPNLTDVYQTVSNLGAHN